MPTPDSPWITDITRIAQAATTEELAAIEQVLFGRSHGTFTLALKALATLPPAERRTVGAELNGWKTRLMEALEERRDALARRAMMTLATDDQIDVTIALPPLSTGHLHPIPSFMAEAEEVFMRLGFDVAEGPELENELRNFDLLNFPKDHPARDNMDTFFIQDSSLHEAPPKKEKVSGRWLLRCHTSPVQIRYMQSHTPPYRMICPGRVYRKDSDATHSPMFHQIEGLMIGRDVTLANMKAVMSAAIRSLVAPDITFRFRTSFFPFTEPSLEVDMRFAPTEEEPHPPWLEVAGCGMVHPNVLQNCGVDALQWRGFAFGFGVERLVMIKSGLRDLRLFTQNDLRFLEQW